MNEEFYKNIIVCLEKIDNKLSEQTKALQLMSEMIHINNDMIKINNEQLLAQL